VRWEVCSGGEPWHQVGRVGRRGASNRPRSGNSASACPPANRLGRNLALCPAHPTAPAPHGASAPPPSRAPDHSAATASPQQPRGPPPSSLPARPWSHTDPRPERPPPPCPHTHSEFPNPARQTTPAATPRHSQRRTLTGHSRPLDPPHHNDLRRPPAGLQSHFIFNRPRTVAPAATNGRSSHFLQLPVAAPTGAHPEMLPPAPRPAGMMGVHFAERTR